MTKRLESWRLFWVLALAVSIANIEVLPAANFRSPEDTEKLVLHSVLCALPLLWIAFTASSLATLWPSKATRWLMSNRRYIGIAFAFGMGWHFAFVGYSTFAFGNHVAAGDLTIDIVGLTFLIAMTVTSFRLMARKVTPSDWRGIHKAGVFVLWFLPTYFYFEDYQDNHQAFYLGVGCAFLTALLIRAMAWASKFQRKHVRAGAHVK